MTDSVIHGDRLEPASNQSATPAVPYSNIHPQRVKVEEPRPIVFEKVAMRALLVTLSRCLSTASRICDEAIKAST